MDLGKWKTFQWITLIGAIAGILSLWIGWESHWRPWVMGITLAAAIGALLAEGMQSVKGAFFSGVKKVDEAFTEAKNTAVFESIDFEYRYLGISFSSSIIPFKSWYEHQKRGRVRLRILLTDPSADDALEFQARYEKNLLSEHLNDQEQRVVRETVQKSKDAIRWALEELALLPAADPAPEIRLHREKLREWMHFVDNRLYLGVLRAGISGTISPVVVMSPRNSHWSLYDHFREEWDSLWARAQPVTVLPPRPDAVGVLTVPAQIAPVQHDAK
jgi:hypothetical protein